MLFDPKCQKKAGRSIFRFPVSLSTPSAQVKWSLLSLLLLTSLVFKLYFVFTLSKYTDHLFSDMGFYWERAHSRFHGDYFGVFQWHANPPFFPIFLDQFFKILFFFGLSKYELESVLVFFIGLSTVSVFLVYGIGVTLTGGFWRAFGAALLYAFCYPILYFNGLVLTENVGTPLIILMLWLVLRKEKFPGWVFTAGMLFGAAVAIRTAFGLIGGCVFLYLWAAEPVSWARFRRAVIFSLGFFLVVFFLFVENFYISKGQFRGLAGYFGFNVFLQYCKVRNACSHYPLYGGVACYNNPTFYGLHRDFGIFNMDRPFNDRAYFFDLVKNCIHDNPHIWIDNLKLFKDVFFYPPWPGLPDIGGYSFWMPVFCYFTLFLTVSIGLFYWVSPGERAWRARSALLLSPLFCALVMCYFFGMEGRYLVPCLFGLYIVFFAALPYLFKNRFKTDIYYSCLLVLFAGFAIGSRIETTSVQKKYGVDTVKIVDMSKTMVRAADGTPGDQWEFFNMANLQSGILLTSPTTREARKIEISTDSWDTYQLTFYLNDKKVGSMPLPAERPPKGGIVKRVLPLPPDMVGKKFNQLLVRPVEGDGNYCLAYLILDPLEKETLEKQYGVSWVQEVDLDKVAARFPDGVPGNRREFFNIPDVHSGILLKAPTPRVARKFEISTDSYDVYLVAFYLDGTKKGELLLPAALPPKGGTVHRVFTMPEGMRGQKFNQILVKPVEGDGVYSLTYFILDPPS